MLWHAEGPGGRSGDGALLLAMPRTAPTDAATLEEWRLEAGHAARLAHPRLATAIEVGVHEQWPFIAYEGDPGRGLDEVLAGEAEIAPADLVGWLCQAADGLAFAHEAGLAHGDPQGWNLRLDEHGQLKLVGLGILGTGDRSNLAEGLGGSRGLSVDPRRLRMQREAAERDVLALGVLAHAGLSGRPAFGQADVGKAIDRLAPLGREVLRMPWSVERPLSEALRSIVNRATHHQPRQRYLSARSLSRALEGWRASDARDTGGPLSLLQDRLATIGLLPARAGSAVIANRLAGAERQHIQTMAGQLLLDFGLSFELLRQVNAASARSVGRGPVLTVRRAAALVGIDGVRAATLQLRPWPGPLSEDAASALQSALERARLAGHLAQALRPAGYDAELSFLLAVLQNLGRIVLHYHFADDAEQVQRLLRDRAPGHAATSEADAVRAVLGVELEALAMLAWRHLGFGEEVMHMLRRLPTERPVRQPDGDPDLLRATASAANEAVDAAEGVGASMDAVAKRYGKLLGVSLRDLHALLAEARRALAAGAPMFVSDAPAAEAAEPLAAPTEV